VQRRAHTIAGVAAVLGLSSALVDSALGAALLYEAGALLCVVSAWYFVAQVPSHNRAPWMFVGAALTLWVVGDVIWDVFTVSGDPPSVSIADAFYMAGYVVLAVGVLRIVGSRAVGRREALLDGTAFAAAMAVVIWILLARPQAESGAEAIESVVLAIYPLLDAILLASLLWLLLTPGGDRPMQRATALAMAAMAVVDVGYAAFAANALDEWLPVANGFYPLAYGLVVVATARAAAMGDEGPVVEVLPHLHPGRALLLGTALVLAPASAAISVSGPNAGDRTFLLVVSSGIALMVLARFVNEARERERIHAEALYLASHDSLTGLTNRRAFLDAVERDVANRTCALLYIDLDGFKWLNDSAGHVAGDDALVHAARLLRAEVRGNDIVARLGGDEFAICCRDVSGVAQAEELAERVRSSLARIHPSMTASVGVATSTEEIRDARMLLQQADAAMYRAKRSGGNRTWTAQPA
jgi:diguanylate cyclase (GGDEF)-like protein